MPYFDKIAIALSYEINRVHGNNFIPDKFLWLIRIFMSTIELFKDNKSKSKHLRFLAYVISDTYSH
jgi:hypothetical protein